MRLSQADCCLSFEVIPCQNSESEIERRRDRRISETESTWVAVVTMMFQELCHLDASYLLSFHKINILYTKYPLSFNILFCIFSPKSIVCVPYQLPPLAICTFHCLNHLLFSNVIRLVDQTLFRVQSVFPSHTCCRGSICKLKMTLKAFLWVSFCRQARGFSHSARPSFSRASGLHGFEMMSVLLLRYSNPSAMHPKIPFQGLLECSSE